MTRSAAIELTQTYTDRIDSAAEVLEYLMIDDERLLPAARRLHHTALALGESPHADLLRLDVCHRIRLGQDEVFAADGDPIHAYTDLLNRAADILEANAGLSTMRDCFMNGRLPYEPLDVTANHYGRLWGGFSPERYFNEAELLLRARLERNGIDSSWFEGKRALDCGCGGGRYTVALKRLGFAEVVGCDWSDEALSVARARASEASITGVTYRKADVLSLPFADNEFDFVFSNGVFHHTNNTEQGVGELIRVMQPEGRGWLYLYARPGGLDRLTHYLARLLLKNADHEVCRNYCRALGMDGNRVFFLLDLWLTPIAECYTPAEVEEMLDRAGCRARQRFTRGSDFDLVEQIQDGTPHTAMKFGVGENRYFFFGKFS